MESTTTATNQSSTKDEKEVATILKANIENSSPVIEVGEKAQESFSSETAKTEPNENKSDKKNKNMPTKEENCIDELKEKYSEVPLGIVIVEEKEVSQMSKKMESASELNGKVHDSKHGTTVVEDADKEQHVINYGCEFSVDINRRVEESANPSVDVVEKEEYEKPKYKESASSEAATTGSDDKLNLTTQKCEKREKGIDEGSCESRVPVVTNVEPQNMHSLAHAEIEILETTNKIESPFNEIVAVQTDETLYDNDKGKHVEEPIQKAEENKDSCADESADINKIEIVNPENKESTSSETATTRSTVSDDEVNQMIQNNEETKRKMERKSSGSKVPVDVTKAEPMNEHPSTRTEKEVLQAQQEDELPITEKVKVQTDEKLYEKGKRTEIQEALEKVEDSKNSFADESVDTKKNEQENPTDKESANSRPSNAGSDEKIKQMVQNCEEKEKERDGRSSDSKVSVSGMKVEHQNVNSLAHTESEILETQNKIESSVSETVNVESDKKLKEKVKEAYVEEPTKKVEDKVSCADESAAIKKAEEDIRDPPVNKEEKKPAVYLTESKDRKDDKTPFEEKKINEKIDKKSGPEVSYNLPKAQEHTSVPQTDGEHKEVEVPKIKESPISEHIIEASQGMTHINKDEMTPIKEKTEKEVRKEPEDSANAGKVPNENGSTNGTKEPQCEITEGILIKGAEAVVKKDVLPDESPKVPETLTSESSKVAVSEIADPAEQKESLSDDVSNVEEQPKALHEKFAKPEDNFVEGHLNTVVSMDKSRLVDPPAVENAPVSDFSALAIKNKSFKGKKNENVKEEVQKFPEILKEIAKESKVELQANLEESTQAIGENTETEKIKESATEEPTEKTLESLNDENDSKADIETTKEEDHVKHANHSSNIISKVKHSIVKVKKKILGKSACSKNVSPDVKT